MATIQQCKMLSARAREVGMEYKFDDFKDLTNGDVDKKVAEIKQFKANAEAVGCKQPVQPKVDKPSPTGQIDGVGFGLCFKKTCDWFFSQPNGTWPTTEHFQDMLERMCKLYIENRSRLVDGSSSSSSSFDTMEFEKFEELMDEYNNSANCEVI